MIAWIYKDLLAIHKIELRGGATQSSLVFGEGPKSNRTQMIATICVIQTLLTQRRNSRHHIFFNFERNLNLIND